MGFRTVATSSRRTWTPSEERVLSILLSDARDSRATAAEVADLAGTHESTVIRLAQKLGYRGYSELRADLRRDELMHSPQAASAADDVQWHPETFGADEAHSLARLGDVIPRDALHGAAETVHASADVYLFAKNDDTPLRDLLARRLRRLGKTTHILNSSAKDIAERFANFGEGSTLVAFALRSTSRFLPDLVAEAHRRGGRTIVITDVAGSPFQPPPDHVLAAPRNDDDEFNTDIVPMAICYLLQRAVFALDPDGYRAARARIVDLTRLLGGRFELPAQE